MKFSLQVIVILFFLKISSNTLFSQSGEISITYEDERIINDIFKKFSGDKNLSTGELIIKIGQHLLETPYVAHTLEINNDEKLVINLREMDCTTFVENCLALARTIKNKNPDANTFFKELQTIRYRAGRIDKYPSRLHYFSDWIFDNEKKKIIRNITAKSGGIIKKLKLDFMSTHPESYSALKMHPQFIQDIARQEKISSKRQFRFVPKVSLKKSEKLIRNGDILGITTDIKGLDIIHVVIAIRQHGKLHILHASQSEGKVMISKETLYELLSKMKKATGIVIARPN